ncbi:hypothetical protein Y032_0056g2655 [Ancylostoma ceylanicum]|uniref:Uncharacterized protein n=1 Tax=Ancylostoma ceylanicum TaxID=53326 RepID=A0A016U4N9_9BILA|nr:hypothetical protein Y032_0056g2655 [Ancylostoma ceylanicum]
MLILLLVETTRIDIVYRICSRQFQGMIQTCSLILHPHSFICKSAMEVFFLLMRHTSNERVCQHLLLCELNTRRKATTSFLLEPVEQTILEIFNEGFPKNQSAMYLNADERKQIISRVTNELLIASGNQPDLRDVDENYIPLIFNRFLDAVEYHMSARQ